MYIILEIIHAELKLNSIYITPTHVQRYKQEVNMFLKYLSLQIFIQSGIINHSILININLTELLQNK